MLEFPPNLARGSYEVCRILFPQDVQSIFESILLYVAVSCKILTGRAMIDEVVFGEEALSTSVVASGEVDLSQEESVISIACRMLANFRKASSYSDVPVKASNLSPMKIAVSYWCLCIASCRHSFRSFSMTGSCEYRHWRSWKKSDQI